MFLHRHCPFTGKNLLPVYKELLVVLTKETLPDEIEKLRKVFVECSQEAMKKTQQRKRKRRKRKEVQSRSSISLPSDSDTSQVCEDRDFSNLGKNSYMNMSIKGLLLDGFQRLELNVIDDDGDFQTALDKLVFDINDAGADGYENHFNDQDSSRAVLIACFGIGEGGHDLYTA